MKIQEAYKIIGASENTSEEELKKIYRNLVLANHPDKGGDEKVMKNINEAYDYILKYRKNPNMENTFNFDFNNVGVGGFGFNPFASIFNQQRQQNFSPPILEIKLTFKEAILGCEKDVKYNRFIKCNDCNGEGNIPLSNGCQNCGGKGKISAQRGNSIFIQTCPKCFGRTNTKPCEHCNSSGVKEEKVNQTVNITGGYEHGTRLSLRGLGHYSGGSLFGRGEYSDAFIILSVEQDKEMKMEGYDVVSNIEISLLEALSGAQKKVNTVYGEKEINIKKEAKNKDIIDIDGCGVKNSVGKHKVIINIKYPDNVNGLIEYLKGE